MTGDCSSVNRAGYIYWVRTYIYGVAAYMLFRFPNYLTGKAKSGGVQKFVDEWYGEFDVFPDGTKGAPLGMPPVPHPREGLISAFQSVRKQENTTACVALLRAAGARMAAGVAAAEAAEAVPPMLGSRAALPSPSSAADGRRGGCECCKCCSSSHGCSMRLCADSLADGSTSRSFLTTARARGEREVESGWCAPRWIRIESCGSVEARKAGCACSNS